MITPIMIARQREPAPEVAQPFIKHIHRIKPKARMEDQFTHKDEKGYREQSECGNGRKDPCHYRNQAWYSPQEKIGGNNIDNKKGKGNGQVGEKHEDHASKEQADDQPPFHGLPSCPNRLLKNDHLRRFPHPSSLRRTAKYTSLLRISGALHLALFEQSGKDYFFSRLLISINLLHAILKNWRVRRMLPMGMMMKIVHFGIVTPLTSVISFMMHSRV